MSDNSATKKLLAISAEIEQNRLPLSINVSNNLGLLKEEFENILDIKNGFIAFESALHFFHSGDNKDYIDINTWNDPSLWIDQYSKEAHNYVFFAQDLFGSQFTVYNNAIYIFEPETGKIEHMADSFELWSQKILDDYEFFTGHPLANEWQVQNGPIKKNMRLVPKIPFVCNGAYEITNFFESNAVESMRFRAAFSKQIKDLPDGAKIEFKFSPN
jgi:hypothetical protein